MTTATQQLDAGRPNATQMDMFSIPPPNPKGIIPVRKTKPPRENKMRDYQERAVADIRRLMARHRRVMYALPTGSGKTELALYIIAKYIAAGLPVLWLTHHEDLVGQTLRRAAAYGIPVWNAYAKRTYNSSALNVQSILKARNLPHNFSRGLLVVDEAHHATAKTWIQSILEWPGHVLGLTATPWRLSKREGFDHIFDALGVGIDTKSLQARGHLAQAEIIAPHGFLGRGVPISSTGEYNLNSVSQDNRTAMVELPVQDWLRLAPDKKSIFYAVDQHAAVVQAKMLRAAGKTVGILISDKTKLTDVPRDISTDREQVIAGFEAGAIQCLVNVMIATEGFDCPSAEVVSIGRLTKSIALYRQMVGRALRAMGDKIALIIDSVGVCLDPDVGSPFEPIDWSLQPRSVTDQKPAPMRACNGGLEEDDHGCGFANLLGARRCSECHTSFGKPCPRCKQFRWWSSWELDIDDDPDNCLMCAKERRRRREREEYAQSVEGRVFNAAWEPARRFTDETKGQSINWAQLKRRVHAPFNRVVAVDLADYPHDPNDVLGKSVNVAIRARNGKVTRRRTRLIWRGEYNGAIRYVGL